MKSYEEAVVFATKAHGSQVRDYTGVPYITHPVAVSKIVSEFDPRPEVAIAAVLHDVVEDTPVTLEEIEAEFGEEVSKIVKYVTKVATPEDGDRKKRFALNAAHYMKGCSGAQNIKIADAIHNLSTLKQYDPKFYKAYRLEKMALNILLTQANSELSAMFVDTVKEK